MPKIAISLCVIARDEAELLGQCLGSASGVCDELVVVDTGSRDGTAELARGLGARVSEFPWCDDFSAARNHCLDQARGDWVLVLDADERIAEPDRARERLLACASGGAAAGQVEMVSASPTGSSHAQITRFFPREGLRYRGRIHEQPTRDGAPLVGVPTGVVVHHSGYTAERLAAGDKLARNRRLLEAQLADDPDSSHDWYQLGRVLEVGEDFEPALEAYRRSVELVADTDPHVPHLFECAATCLRALDRSPQALEWLSQVEGVFSERPDTVFLVALLAMDVGQFERAERGFLRCLELGQKGPFRPGPAESSEAARGLAPAHNLGVLYECTERPDQARAAYERALAFDPEHAGARAGLARLSAGG